ncbi:cyanophycinase [Actinomadura sp. DC4]|uniref:cyanophycinase n=1 Tax=Actinomadura sp. DC4 TaxID=3055069 RepID=UPI0025AFFB2F|nr:cyanophycinase [Actinomadura sp. DC4]MDN3353056.1 cyanophycinase [Actinomadura sp. DC4]
MTDITEGNGTGRLLVIGGRENRTCGTGPLEEFVALSGAQRSRIVVVTTATGVPEEVTAEYSLVFGRLGVSSITELRLIGRTTADDPASLTMLEQATGVLISGGDQSRLSMLVGSKTNVLLHHRLHCDGLVIAGTSAGATALGRWMILGGDGRTVTTSSVRIGPGLDLLGNVLIDMHFAERGRLPRLLSGIALDVQYLGVGIDEDTAIVVDGDHFEVIGSGVVTVVDADRATVAHAANNPMALFDVRLHLLPAGCCFDLEQRKPWFGPTREEEE